MRLLKFIMNKLKINDPEISPQPLAPPSNPLDIKLEEVDHLIHKLHISGSLAKLTDQQVRNITHALQSDPRFKIQVEALDHVIYEMKKNGELKNLSSQQVDNIVNFFNSAGLLLNFKDGRKLTYDDDYLFSVHPANFLEEDCFKEAYHLATHTYSWLSYDRRWAVYNYCWAAEYAQKLEGDFVVYGAGRGGFPRAQIHYIDFLNQPIKTFYLLDPFFKIPQIDLDLEYYEYCEKYFSYYDDVCKTFSPYQNVKLIKGVMQESIEQISSDKICFLGINIYPFGFETEALHYCWDKLTKGALIILGDHAGGQAYTQAKPLLDNFVKKKGSEILMLPTGQGLIIKA